MEEITQTRNISAQRSSVWRSTLLAVAAMFVLVALGIGIDYLAHPRLEGPAFQAAGVVLALAPALIWLFVFYLQDRLEPEPVGSVARLFVIGLALAGALSIPLTEQFFNVHSWLYQDRLATILGAILLIGAVQAFTVYAAVRYFIFDSPEFDERTDGVIYASAAALGYATAINIQFILSSPGAAIAPSLVYMAEVALAQAAFGGLLGYFLGRARLEREPIWWLPLGLALTALLNGVFQLLSIQFDPGEVILGESAGLPSIANFILAGLLVLVITGLVFFLINRDIARSLAGVQPPLAADRQVGDRQANLLTLALFAACLIGGALTWNQAANRSQAFAVEGIKGRVEASFSQSSLEGQAGLRFTDRLNRSVQVTLAVSPLSSGQDAAAVAARLAGERGSDFEIYRVLDQSKTSLGGRPALSQHFAYVTAPLSNVVPRLWEGEDVIVVDGSRVILITLAAPREALSKAQAVFERFIKSLSF